MSFSLMYKDFCSNASETELNNTSALFAFELDEDDVRVDLDVVDDDDDRELFRWRSSTSLFLFAAITWFKERRSNF